MARYIFLLPIIALLLVDICYTASRPHRLPPRKAPAVALGKYERVHDMSQIPQNFDPRLSEEVMMTPKKRPFCNAFTGCGRKRSQGAPGMPVQELMRQRQFVEDDTIPILEENGIEELSRQILSEAKLWEAIQEASAEIARRKQKELSFN